MDFSDFSTHKDVKLCKIFINIFMKGLFIMGVNYEFKGLRDDEKFVLILNKYSAGKTQKKIAKEMGTVAQTLASWKNKKTHGIQITNRNKISEYFQLKETIWTDAFYDKDEFQKRLESYRKPKSKTSKSKYPLNKVSKDEKVSLAILSKKSQLLLSDFSLKKQGHPFMFELAKLLKNNGQIKEALSVLEQIEESDNSFKYTSHNEIQHLKVNLLSHKSIYDWDKAIHILKMLESASHYHFQEPEVITLLASNYKRKALSKTDDKSKWKDKKNIDINLLSLAIIKYREAYSLREKEKYYDAINFAYLHSIADSIQMEYANPKEIKNTYKTVSIGWKIDKSNWWEVATNSEFLMLTGDVKIAKSLIGDFLENHTVKKFEIETTLRQLEMYVHFTDSEDGKSFYKYLDECWESLKKPSLNLGKGKQKL